MGGIKLRPDWSQLRRFHGHCGADRALGMVSPRGHGDAVFKRHPISQTDALAKAGHDLEALAKKGINIFFTQVFRDSFFHADMHPGNLHVDDNGRFVLFDYGIVGRLSDFDKEYLARNFIAFFNRDYRRVAQMHVEAGWTPPDTDVADLRPKFAPFVSRYSPSR